VSDGSAKLSGDVGRLKHWGGEAVAFVTGQAWRNLTDNFRDQTRARETFRTLRGLRRVLPKRLFDLFLEKLTSVSWPYILTDHGFGRSLSSFDRGELWQKLEPALALFRARGFEVVLTGGALLTLWRDGRLQKYDDDLDIVLYRRGATIEEVAREHSNLPRSFSELDWSVRHSESSFHNQFSLGDTLPGVDVFPIWDVDSEDVFVYAAGVLPRDAVFPVSSFLDSDQVIPFPQDPPRLLELFYGDWRTPDNVFKFDWTAAVRKGHLAEYHALLGTFRK